MGKIRLIEEVKSESGHTKEEIRKEFWNSPPSLLGEGRYLLIGELGNETLKELQKRGLAQYWDREFLGECDLFCFSPGWRLGRSAVGCLRKKGYQVEIETLEEQEEKREEEKRKRKEEKAKEEVEKEEMKGEFEKEVADYEKFLGSPKWRRQEGDKDYLHAHLTTISNSGKENEYIRYGLTEDNRIFCHRHYFSDCWDNLVSENGAPPEVILEAERIRTEREEERKEEVRREKERIKKGLQSMLKRTTFEEIKRRKLKKFCPRELVEGGGRKVELTIEQAKEILSL